MKSLLAEVNVSEGRDADLIEALREQLMLTGDVRLIDQNSDGEHNRTVFTYTGEPQAVLAATQRLAAEAVRRIDMTTHTGKHPRIGAIDVVPFIPVNGVSTEEAVEIARAFGKYLGSLGVSVYYYEEAATAPSRKSLVDIRKGEYEGLEMKMQLPEWTPDEGPAHFVPKSGATVTGVRFPLVAFNVNLGTTDLSIGKKIVKAVRGATGGYQHVRAIALDFPDKNAIQVSMNLTNYSRTPIHRVFETIKSEASAYGVSVIGTELVGPVPLMALEDLLKFYLRVQDFSMEQIY